MSITINQANRWIKAIADPGKFGWKNELKKSQTLILKEQAGRFKKHTSPSGIAWKKTKSKKVKIGQVAAIAKDERPGSAMKGKFFVRRVLNSKEKKIVNKRKMGSKNALYRSSGKNKVTTLFKAAVKKNDQNHFIRITNTGIVFGPRRKVHPGKFQYGTSKMDARPFYGVSTVTSVAVGEIFKAGYLKRIKKKAPR